MTGRDARAFLLPFYLDPKKSSPGVRVEYAMAHLVFVNEASAKTRITHGCWINASLDCTEMRPGETKYLILAIGSRDSSGPFVALSTDRTAVGWEKEAGGKAFEDFELSPGKYNVEITLIWGGDSEFRKAFTYRLLMQTVNRQRKVGIATEISHPPIGRRLQRQTAFSGTYSRFGTVSIHRY